MCSLASTPHTHTHPPIAVTLPTPSSPRPCPSCVCHPPPTLTPTHTHSLFFCSAYNTPWGHSQLRYVGDGRPFWRFIVEKSTGCANEALFEELYQYYIRPEAWQLAPGAVSALNKLRAAGVRLAVVSNFDTRLRPILTALEVDKLFDAVVVSAEVGAEKPNPVIFETAMQQLGVRPYEVVHVGDDRRNDVWGARDAGVAAWLWGVDVHSFDEVAKKVLKGPAAYAESDSEDDEA